MPIPEEQTINTWGRYPISFVYPVNPFRLNERLIIQQGVFLCPGDVSIPFEDNLFAVLPPGTASPPFYKLKIKHNARSDYLRKLHRMNMNTSTLFPGLDGFARSLNNILAFPEILKSDLDW